MNDSYAEARRLLGEAKSLIAYTRPNLNDPKEAWAVVASLWQVLDRTLDSLERLAQETLPRLGGLPTYPSEDFPRALDQAPRLVTGEDPTPGDIPPQPPPTGPHPWVLDGHCPHHPGGYLPKQDGYCAQCWQREWGLTPSQSSGPLSQSTPSIEPSILVPENEQANTEQTP